MNFIIRVELHGHGHDSPAYTRLHAAMATKNVLRTVTSGDGRFVQLPSATYSYAGDFTNVAVREWVGQIVDSLNYKCSILVTSGDSAWFNLPFVK